MCQILPLRWHECNTFLHNEISFLQVQNSHFLAFFFHFCIYSFRSTHELMWIYSSDPQKLRNPCKIKHFIWLLNWYIHRVKWNECEVHTECWFFSSQILIRPWEMMKIKYFIMCSICCAHYNIWAKYKKLMIHFWTESLFQ